MNGSYLTKNCFSRYEISNLWDLNNEWLSTQYYGPPSASGGYFIASTIDQNDNLLEGYLMNGTVGPTQVYNNANPNSFFGSSSTNPLLPIFGGVRAVSVDATLGSKAANSGSIDYGAEPGTFYDYISAGGNATNGIMTGSIGNASGYSWNYIARYMFSHNATTNSTAPWNSSSPVTSRCAGQVSP